MKLIHTAVNRSRLAIVKYNDTWEEYVVKFYINDTYQNKADYFTDCRDDAESTANVWCSQAPASGIIV